MTRLVHVLTPDSKGDLREIAVNPDHVVSVMHGETADDPCCVWLAEHGDLQVHMEYDLLIDLLTGVTADEAEE